MKKLFLASFLITLTISGFSQKMACFSDANVDMPVLTPPLINREAYLNEEIKEIRIKYQRWIETAYQHKGLSENDYYRLKGIGIAIMDVDNSLGMTRNDSIFVDKGLIIGMADYAFSESLLQTGYVDTAIYNRWHNDMINALIKGDPVTYVTGTTIYDADFAKIMKADTTAGNIYQATYNSWIAFILLHEASHILLKHIEKWHAKYPHFTNANLDKWGKEQFAYSQDQELEADELFLKIYMQYAKFDPFLLLGNCADWFILREGFYSRKGFTLFQTHPPTKVRFEHLVRTYCRIAAIGADTCKNIVDLFNRYYETQHKQIVDDLIVDVPKMSGNRPDGIDEHKERFMLRDAQLQILFTRLNKKQ